MSRWEPNARGRLEQAALELFGEHGFDQTTVEDIATRAGVTKRTFFRHFPDKREALFGGQDEFMQLFVAGIAGAPVSATPLEAIAVTLDAVGAALGDRREAARRRHLVIAANAELQERELVKLASLATALAEALRVRGVPEPAASITAETAIAVFRNAFERWVTGPDQPDLRQLIRESLMALRTVTAGE